MRFLSRIAFLVACLAASPLYPQDAQDRPTSEKAQKTFDDGLKMLHQGNEVWALDDFKKADKQDGSQCKACQIKMIKYGVQLQDWKTAELAAQEMIAEGKDVREIARAHYQFAVVLFDQAVRRNKDEYFTRSHEEAAKAVESYPNFPDAVLLDGRALAYLRQDDAARVKFQAYLTMKAEDDADRQRALRYLERPELVRARMAPPFAVTTMDGKRISWDDLQGKVVLLDFWATWCAPCREAMPRIRAIAKKFEGQPLVILSVSLDADEEKWKEYVATNQMTWLQYRDGGFTGSISKLFSVEAIPHTFTIDADGVLQEEHIGDAAIEGTLKKLLARARDVQPQKSSL
jgi:thiol-disulfide isomerase/thioredoxin